MSISKEEAKINDFINSMSLDGETNTSSNTENLEEMFDILKTIIPKLEEKTIPENKFLTFQTNVLNWADERGILENGTLDGQTLKFCEEAGEVAGAVAKKNGVLLADALGDTLVTMIIISSISGIELENAMDVAWNEIKDRTGHLTEEGVFVKDE